MGLFQLDLAVRKLRVDKAAGPLRALDLPWDGNVAGAMAEFPSMAGLSWLSPGSTRTNLPILEARRPCRPNCTLDGTL